MNLTIELRDEVAQALEAKAQESGVSAKEYAQQVIEEQVSSELPQVGDSEEAHGKHASEDIVDIIRRIWAKVPAEELAKLPRDGASQIDHYIYGWPKREK